jgi:hypothetical protein
MTCAWAPAIERGQRAMRPVLQDRVMISGIGALAAIDIVRGLRSVPDGIAQGFQPAERRLFSIGLGEARTHRTAFRPSDGNVQFLAWRQGEGALLLGA